MRQPRYDFFQNVPETGTRPAGVKNNGQTVVSSLPFLLNINLLKVITQDSIHLASCRFLGQLKTKWRGMVSLFHES